MKIKAFTMAEAILTMVILGVIAAIMIANLKPVQYRNEGFKVTYKKVYAELDDVINTILVSCASGNDLGAVYNDCDAKNGSATHAFGENATDGTKLLPSYIRILDGGCSVTPPNTFTSVSKFKMKNGACVALMKNAIWIDVNDEQGPNADEDKGLDRYLLTVGSEGIETAPPR